MSLGLKRKVKTYRIICDKTQEEMAAIIGVTVQTYRLKENGTRTFTEHEMSAFLNEVRKVKPAVSLEDIFLN